MSAAAPASSQPLQAFMVELRTPSGLQRRYVTATDVVEASNRAVGAMAIEAPDAEVVRVEHMGPALVR